MSGAQGLATLHRRGEQGWASQSSSATGLSAAGGGLPGAGGRGLGARQAGPGRHRRRSYFSYVFSVAFYSRLPPGFSVNTEQDSRTPAPEVAAEESSEVPGLQKVALRRPVRLPPLPNHHHRPGPQSLAAICCA